MNYLDTLESELKSAGIPPRRRTRILTEFADHLQQDPNTDLGAPLDIARQFADELGTRLARSTAYRAFVVLGASAVALTILFFEYGRTWGGWGGYGYYPVSGYFPRWWVPLMIMTLFSAQIALAAGVFALLRAWRLRHETVITAADAAVINRRTAVALICGAITMAVPPLTDTLGGLGAGQWPTAGLIIGLIAIVMLLAMLPSVLSAARCRPERSGVAGDLVSDLGTTGIGISPWHAAIVLSIVILSVFTLIGIRNNTPIDGLLRGAFDAAACMAGFTFLGRYLGLRATS